MIARPCEILSISTLPYTDHRTTKNGKQQLVHWKGYDQDKNTWKPAKMIEKDAPEAVKDYKEVLAELGESPMDMDLEQDFLCQTNSFHLWFNACLSEGSHSQALR